MENILGNDFEGSMAEMPVDPDDVAEEEEDEFDEGEEDEEEELELDDYLCKPFAMEVVNGEIISLDDSLLDDVAVRLRQRIKASDEELAEYVRALANDDEEVDDERFGILNEYDLGVTLSLLGLDDDLFDELAELVDPRSYHIGTEAWDFPDLLKGLGYDVQEDIRYGPHGHGTIGVIYVDRY